MTDIYVIAFHNRTENKLIKCQCEQQFCPQQFRIIRMLYGSMLMPAVIQRKNV